MNDVAARMAALRRRFAASAVEQESSLRAAIHAEDRGKMIALAHHLAGAAGIFGHPELGEMARRLETSLDGGASAEAVRIEAADLLGALRRLGESA